MTKYLIRSMLHNDDEGVQAFLSSRALSLGGDGTNNPVAYTWVALRKSLNQRYITAEDPPVVLGVVSVLRSNTIGVLFVQEDCRGCGIGSELLRQAETLLHLRVGEVFLTVPMPVAPWLERRGYQRQSPMTWTDGVRMWKPLPEPCGGPRDF